MTNIGLHVSAAGSLDLAPGRAAQAGAECFQFFSRSPQGGPAKEISEELAASFRAAMAKEQQRAAYIHAPYYINFASAKKQIFHGSISVVRAELERGSLLGVKALMTHLGTLKDLGEEKGMLQVVDGLAAVMEGYIGETQFLVEISAGAGQIVGDTFAEIAFLLNHPKLSGAPIGVCFDTAHAFASGYDLRTPEVVAKTFKMFDQEIGLDRLMVIHSNDSLVELGARRDRHAHIGQGKIGKAGFAAIVAVAKKRQIDLILETPHDGQELTDIEVLKKMRG